MKEGHTCLVAGTINWNLDVLLYMGRKGEQLVKHLEYTKLLELSEKRQMGTSNESQTKVQNKKAQEQTLVLKSIQQ